MASVEGAALGYSRSNREGGTGCRHISVAASLGVPETFVQKRVRNKTEVALLMDVGSLAARLDWLVEQYSAQAVQACAIQEAFGIVQRRQAPNLEAQLQQLEQRRTINQRDVHGYLEEIDTISASLSASAASLLKYAEVNACVAEELASQGHITMVVDKKILAEVEGAVAQRIRSLVDGVGVSGLKPLVEEVEEIEARNHIQSDIDITGGRTQTLSPEVATPRGIVRASLRGDAAPSTSPSRCSAISASEEGAPYVAKGLSGSTAEAEDGATGAAVKSNGIGKDTERLEEADVDAFRTPEPQAVLFHGLVTPYSHIPLEPTSSSIQCAQRSVASGSGRRSRAASQDANMCKEIAIAAKATDQEALDPPSPSTEPIAPEPLRLGTEAAGADDCVDDPRAAKKMCRGTSKPKSINDGLHTPQYHSKQLNPDEDQRRFPDQLLGAAEEDAAGSVCAQLGVSCSAPVFLTVPQPGDVVSDSQSSREQDEDELLGSQLGLASQHLSAPWHQDETVAGT